MPNSAQKAVRTLLDHGWACVQQGKHDDAIADFDKAIALDSENDSAYFGRGFAHKQKGAIDRAIANFDTAIKLYPNHAQVYTNRATAYEKKGAFDRAIADYTKAIEINSKDARTYIDRATAYEKKGAFDSAIADYTKAIEIDSEYCLAYDGRAAACEKKGAFDSAIADYIKLIEMSSEDDTAYVSRETESNLKRTYISRATASEKKGAFDSAIADYTKAIEIDSEDDTAYVSRGLVYEKRGDIEQAITDFQKALEIKPHGKETESNLKRMLAIHAMTIREVLLDDCRWPRKYLSPSGEIARIDLRKVGGQRKSGFVPFGFWQRLKSPGAFLPQESVLPEGALLRFDDRLIDNREFIGLVEPTADHSFPFGEWMETNPVSELSGMMLGVDPRFYFQAKFEGKDWLCSYAVLTFLHDVSRAIPARPLD